jgi:hypothetical protein
VAYAFPDSKGFGGNTTTAQLARKVFHSEELRGRLVNLCPEIYKQAMSRILFNDLILLRLMSCDYLLLPAKIGRIFCPKFSDLEYFIFNDQSLKYVTQSDFFTKSYLDKFPNFLF